MKAKVSETGLEAILIKSRCRHQTGSFFESIEACHERQVVNGVLEPDSFNNEYGNGLHHTYECKLCGKIWRWKSHPKTKWLKELFENAYTENRDLLYNKYKGNARDRRA